MSLESSRRRDGGSTGYYGGYSSSGGYTSGGYTSGSSTGSDGYTRRHRTDPVAPSPAYPDPSYPSSGSSTGSDSYTRRHRTDPVAPTPVYPDPSSPSDSGTTSRRRRKDPGSDPSPVTSPDPGTSPDPLSPGGYTQPPTRRRRKSDPTTPDSPTGTTPPVTPGGSPTRRRDPAGTTPGGTTPAPSGSPSRRTRPPKQDPYTQTVPPAQLQQQTNALRSGGHYKRDLHYDTHITNKTTVIINNKTVNVYAPRYYRDRTETRYPTWGGGFWAGYTAGYINGAIDQSYYDRWNAINVGEYYEFPRETWQPYYTTVLSRPAYEPDVDYSQPAAWQTPPLDKNQDPLEQLANYGQLQKPGQFMFWTTHSNIGAIEARDRLNKGEEVDVAGVAVHSWQELAAVVPEVVRGNQGNLPADAQQALQYTTVRTTGGSTSVASMTTSQLVDKLPDFSEVYSPKSVQAEDEVDGKKVNRTMDAAAAVYDRPEVRQAIAQWWSDNPSADRDALNHEINQVVTKALVDDLSTNGDAYAQDPSYASNPVYYLNPSDPGYNRAAIAKVLSDGPSELQQNLIVKENAQ